VKKSGGIYTPRPQGTLTLLPMLFYLTLALSRPPISLSLQTPGPITPLPMPIRLVSALSKVLFVLCARSPVEAPFTARKPARVVTFTLPLHPRRFLKTLGCFALRAAPLRSKIEGLWCPWHPVVGSERTFGRFRRFAVVSPAQDPWKQPPICKTAIAANASKVIEEG